MDVSRDFTLTPNTGYQLIKRTLQDEDISLLRNVSIHSNQLVTFQSGIC